MVSGLWDDNPKYNPKHDGGLNYVDVMNQMQQLGFNTIRIPLSNDILTSKPRQYSIDFAKNPDLLKNPTVDPKDLTSLDVLQHIVDYAGQMGMWIILDHHQSAPGNEAR